MKSWWRRIRALGILVTVVLSVPLIYLTAEHIRGRRLLTQRLAEMRSSHELPTVAELAPKTLAPEENAAPDIIPLKDALTQNRMLMDFVDCRIAIGQGGAVPIWKLKYWYNSNLTRVEWSDIESQLVQNKEILQTIRSALSRPGFDSGYHYDLGLWKPGERNGTWSFNAPQVDMLSRCAELLSISISVALHKGDRDLAMRDLLLLIKLGSKQLREPLLAEQSRRSMVANLAMDTTWTALQAPGWTEDQLSALQSAWAGCDFENDMLRALKMEQAMQRVEYETLKQIPEALNQYLFLMEPTQRGYGDRQLHPSAQTWFLYHVYGPMWKFAWADLDEYLLLDHFRATIHQAQMVCSNSWNSIAPSLSAQGYGAQYTSGQRTSWFNQKRFLICQLDIRISPYLIRVASMAQTYCGMTQAAIALERFKLREHKLPAVLEDLTPAYLSSVPIDRMDGKPLRYTPFSDGSYLLYSVGLNGKDDGGNANSKQAGGFVGLDWHAPDAVWPTLATDDEIKKSRVVRE